MRSYTYSLSSSWLEEVMHKNFILYHESCAENIPFFRVCMKKVYLKIMHISYKFPKQYSCGGVKVLEKETRMLSEIAR